MAVSIGLFKSQDLDCLLLTVLGHVVLDKQQVKVYLQLFTEWNLCEGNQKRICVSLEKYCQKGVLSYNTNAFKSLKAERSIQNKTKYVPGLTILANNLHAVLLRYVVLKYLCYLFFFYLLCWHLFTLCDKIQCLMRVKDMTNASGVLIYIN